MANRNKYAYTNQKQVRDAFWDFYLETTGESRKPKRTDHQYNAGIRTVFSEFVDSLSRSGMISDKLAYNVTL